MRAAPRNLVLTAVVAWLWPALAAAQATTTDCGYYAYGGGSEGRHCTGASGSPPPQRVTALCRDNTYSYEQGSWACWDHGGVQVWRR